MSTSSSSFGCCSFNSDSGLHISEEENEEVPAGTGNDLIATEAENKTQEPTAPVEVVEAAPVATAVSRGVPRKRKR